MREIGPLIAESAATEATNVEVVMNELSNGYIVIPDYQRDSDQWDDMTKSLLVESVINNLSIPAFFFERVLKDNIETNEVIDGQQRLTTLQQYFSNKLRLVEAHDAPYISPNSIHYAGKKFSELPMPFQQAFKRYRLTIIKLRDLGDMRLEIFRRINQGGTPLSGQDIRLAYYGDGSKSLSFIRLVGIFDRNRPASQKFLDGASDKFGIDFPWEDHIALEAWNDWWSGQKITHGQTASEMFLWSLVVAQAQQLNDIIKNVAALRTLRAQFHRSIDEALDVFCAQLSWQDKNPDQPAVLLTFDAMREHYFPFFQAMIGMLLAQKGPSLSVSKHRAVAAVIGAAFRAQIDPQSLSEQQWTNLVEYARRPSEIASSLGYELPQSRGRWDGAKGYCTQMEVTQQVIAKIANER